MKKILGVILITICLPLGSFAQEKDLLGEALKTANFDRSDLGYRPKGYWSRFPLPQQTPYVLPFFTDLFSEPLQVYEFTKNMGIAAQKFLSPEYLNSNSDALYQSCFFLGIDKKIAGFRKLGTNHLKASNDSTAMFTAFEELSSRFDKRMGKSQRGLVNLGKSDDWLDEKEELLRKSKSLPPEIRKILTDFTLNISEAYGWRETAVRNIPYETMTKVYAIRSLGTTAVDNFHYYPEIDDAMKYIDEQSLYYACTKVMQASETAKCELEKFLKNNTQDLSSIDFDFNTPIGRIIIGGTSGDIYRQDDVLAIFDLGGDDEYYGNFACSRDILNPFGVVIDLSGNDKYISESEKAPAQGAGIFGAGILIDVDGDDIYRAGKFAQGMGLFGLGILLDEKGKDDYRLVTSGQGCGYFGVGICIDGAGDDTYYICGDGQGFGGCGGVGSIVDVSGNDKYTAEPDAKVWFRGDYHSNFKININNAQGVGAGRRGDMNDGHSWAGGLGTLVDLAGDDEYLSGNWSLGTGYWFGTGLMYEGGGNDIYKSCYFTQASGAHFCIGCIIDEGGEDQHILYETGGAGIAFGWDYTIALLLDKGGNDKYQAKCISMGLSEIRSNAFLIDIGGDDQYIYGAGQAGLGASAFMESYKNSPVSGHIEYNNYGNSFCSFIDIGGNDKYLDWDVVSDKMTPSKKWNNNSKWEFPTKGDKTYGSRSFGVGIDAEKGSVPEFQKYYTGN